MRDERDKVRPESREAPQLLGGVALGRVHADVLHRGRDLTGEQTDQLGLVLGEGVGFLAGH